MKRCLFIFLLFSWFVVLAQERTFTLKNNKVIYTLVFRNGQIVADTLRTTKQWSQRFGNKPARFVSDADFSIDIFWTSWSAPGKIENADNAVHLTKKDFVLDHIQTYRTDKAQMATLYFRPKGHYLKLEITYQLPDNAFFIRKKLRIIDTIYDKHFLRFMAPMDFLAPKQQVTQIVKDGGFGQPIAFELQNGGVFFGIEYPAATQTLKHCKQNHVVKAWQEIGRIIDSSGISSDWAVMGITPNKYIKLWFYRYLDNVRVAKLRPYTLYNSWYDLRSPEYPGVTPDHVMNEANVMKIIDLLEQNMVKKHGIHLDAFVLDDGWDVYQSDWQLNRQTFPNGLKPISDRLQKMGTVLGIWFGPTGGYSFRNRRISWMKAHGYEVTGSIKKGDAMLCIAGKNYSHLLTKRFTDFVRKYGIGYYKWDGIQFSCSDPTHGHPIGIYSRRAIMQSLIQKCDTVRALNPNIFLNITSGTWLSPWWVKYANTIWMQGMDYGFANLPSISTRDAAMTYRDYVLYQDFKQNGFWFPIANLMTHGIIKGKLQRLGKVAEPIDKFTNNALLYVARGVAMYELYISPDLLTDAEWNAIAQSLHWAKANFDLLKNSFYVGGNPAKGQPYAYVHYKGQRGIIAARNPFVDKKTLYVKLDPALGFASNAKDLVVEQIYPYHQIMPHLYKSGDSIAFDLDGYETAIYNVYPIEQAPYPLITGVKFRITGSKAKTLSLSVYDIKSPHLLNPKAVRGITDASGKNVKLEQLPAAPEDKTETVFYQDSNSFVIGFKDKRAKNLQIAVLYEAPQHNAPLPEIILVSGQDTLKPQINKEKNKWIWLTFPVKQTEFSGRLIVNHAKGGTISVYAIYDLRTPVYQLSLNLREPVKLSVMPPEIYEIGQIHKTVQILKKEFNTTDL